MSILSEEQKKELKDGLNKIIGTAMQFAEHNDWNPNAEVAALTVVIEAENLLKALNK